MPDYTGKLKSNGKIKSVKSIDPSEADEMFETFIAEYIENPTLDGETFRSKTIAETTSENDAILRENAIAKTTFTRLQIRDAMKALNMETNLDTLLSSNLEFNIYWHETTGEIDLTHSLTIQALASFTTEQIEAIKLKIAGIE